MVKKRLIFTFLFEGLNCVLSRNFSLQKVGTVEWIKRNFKLESIAYSIDELVLLNVSRTVGDIDGFCEIIKKISESFFMPIAAGGNIRSFQDAKKILRSGADKIVLNTPIFNNSFLVKELIDSFGSQCIVASIDYLKQDGSTSILTRNGSERLNLNIYEGVEIALDLRVGEIYLTSIEKDGTGMGFDNEVLSKVVSLSPVPIIASGGAGDYYHLAECFSRTETTAVSTANLFNFLGNGLLEARNYLITKGFNMAKWEIGCNRLII